MQMIELDLTKARPQGMRLSAFPPGTINLADPPDVFIAKLLLPETTRLSGQWQLEVGKISEWHELDHKGSINFTETAERLRDADNFGGHWCPGCWTEIDRVHVHIHYAAPGCEVSGHENEGCYVCLTRLRVVGDFEIVYWEPKAQTAGA